jgi:hypothetical protein
MQLRAYYAEHEVASLRELLRSANPHYLHPTDLQQCGCLRLHAFTEDDVVTRLLYNYDSLSTHHQCGASGLATMTANKSAKP